MGIGPGRGVLHARDHHWVCLVVSRREVLAGERHGHFAFGALGQAQLLGFRLLLFFLVLFLLFSIFVCISL